MPTYDYQCRACGATTEVIHSMLEDGPSTCQRCGGDLRRVLYPAGIIFKGPGFYRTDSRSAKTARDTPSAGSSDASQGGSSTSSGAASDSGTSGGKSSESGSTSEAGSSAGTTGGARDSAAG